MRVLFHARRVLMLKVIIVMTFLGSAVTLFFELEPLRWFEDSHIQWYIAAGMIGYKVIELRLLYGYFVTRALNRFHAGFTDERKTIASLKRFLTLTPHGSTIFGLVTYKLTGFFGFFLLFMFIAAIVLWRVDPCINTKKSY